MTVKTVRIIIIAAAALAVAALYFLYSPLESNYFPRCPLKMLTGYDCPSCGAQRAFHAALHGNFMQAIRHNLFLLIALPYVAAAAVASCGSGRVAAWTRRNLLSPAMLWTYIGLYFIWWIVRNIAGL